MKLLRVLLLLPLFVLGACGSNAGPNEKSLFSVWIENNSGLPFDLTGGQFDKEMLRWHEGCTYKLKFVGSESSGMFIETGYVNCYLYGNPIPYSDITTGTYFKSNNKLNFTVRTENGESIEPLSFNFH